MNVLFICNKPPFPAKEGGPIAMDMMIKGLLQEGHHVKVLAASSHKYPFRPDLVPGQYRQQTGIEAVDVDLRVKPVPAFVNLFSGHSYHAERFVNRKFRGRLTEILRGQSFDIVQLETVFMCAYIDDIRKHSDARIVLRAHNIEYLIWKRLWQSEKRGLKKFYLKHLWTTLKSFELQALSQVDGIAAITSKDAGFFRQHIHKVPIVSIPFGIDLQTEELPLDADSCEIPSLFHIGSMDWMPNQEGIRWFLDEVWPGINQEFPGLKLYLAGRNMPAWLRNGTWPDVVVVGEVDDARIFMHSAQIMVVPLLSGSGIRIKIIEAMAASRTVISTPIGAEGIECRDGHDILLAETPSEFLEAVRRCVANDVFCSHLGQNARLLVQRRHDRKKLIADLLSFYNELQSRRI